MNKQPSIDAVFSWCGFPETSICKPSSELSYAIKSVKLNMPWIHNIIVTVTDGWSQDKASEYLDMKTIKQIHFVRASEFIPKKFLPTDNSNVVESWIWRIKGLSDNFVYLNDDTYIGKPTSRNEFFLDNMPVARINQGPTHHPALADLDPISQQIPFSRMWANAYSKYGIEYTRLAHNALPYNVTFMKQLYKNAIYKNAVNAASLNKIRAGEHDFNLLRFSLPLALQQGKALLKVTSSTYDYFVESDDIAGIKKIPKIKPQFFCINNNSDTTKESLVVLKKMFG